MKHWGSSNSITLHEMIPPMHMSERFLFVDAPPLLWLRWCLLFHNCRSKTPSLVNILSAIAFLRLDRSRTRIFCILLIFFFNFSAIDHSATVFPLRVFNMDPCVSCFIPKAKALEYKWWKNIFSFNYPSRKNGPKKFGVTFLPNFSVSGLREKTFSVFFVDSDFFRRTETNFGSNRMWKMLNGQNCPVMMKF